MKKLNVGEETLALQFRVSKIKAEREYKFHPTRRWKFDFAFPEQKIAVEIEGGIWSYGRHNRPSGFLKDMEKYNAAIDLGWKVLKFTPQQIKTGQPLQQIMRVLFFAPAINGACAVTPEINNGV